LSSRGRSAKIPLPNHNRGQGDLPIFNQPYACLVEQSYLQEGTIDMSTSYYRHTVHAKLSVEHIHSLGKVDTVLTHRNPRDMLSRASIEINL